MADPSRSAPLDRFEAWVLVLASSVAFVGATSLALAAVGRLYLWSWLTIAAGATVAVAVALHRSCGVGLHRRARWLVLPAVVLAVLFMFPGYRYATGDKDPGVYVMHAWNMAHTSHLPIQKTALQMTGALSSFDNPGSLWRGFQFASSPTQVMPSFFHMWPAMLGAGFQLLGFGALTVVGPMLGVIGVLLVFALARRLLTTWHAVLSSLFIAVDMMQVWQARYPTSEVLAQVLYLGAALALLVAVRTKSKLVACLAGFFATCEFLVRAEGVLALLIFGGLLALLALRREFRTMVAWAWVGALVPLPLAWWQAYGWAAGYAAGVRTPPGRTVLVLLVLEIAVLAIAKFGDPLLPRLVDGAERLVRRSGLVLGWAAAIAAGVLAIVDVLRPLTGEVTAVRNGVVIRTFDEYGLQRLALFLTWPGLLLAIGGVMVAAVRHRQRDVVMFTSVSMFFVVLFLYRAWNSPQMMWWNRRFVPTVLPALAIFFAIGVIDGWAWFRELLSGPWRRVRHLGRPVAVVLALATLFAIAVPARQSWYLRQNNEKAGSYEVATSIASIAEGKRAVFLWQRERCCGAAAMLFGSPTWIYGGVDSGLLPVDSAEWASYVDGVHRAAPDAAVYLVLTRGADPAMGKASTTLVRQISGQLHAWEESNIVRPSHVMALPYDLDVYQVQSAPG